MDEMMRQFSRLVTLALPLACAGCAELGVSLPTKSLWSKEVDSNLVYALGSRDSFESPLSQRLKPACPALKFKSRAFAVTKDHRTVLTRLATGWEQSKCRLLIAGYAPPTLPEDYARSLSERRAQAVRQALIELGIEAVDIQTVGFGSDFGPSGPNQDVVVIFQEGGQETPPEEEEAVEGRDEDPNLITVGRFRQ